MTDDLSFEPFPFDFDFVESFPLDDFDVSNDPGFPRFWENIDDLFGRGLDIFGFIGEALKDLWSTIWEGIGGSVRWVWEKVWYRVNDIWHWIWDWPGGLVQRLWDRVGDVWSWIWWRVGDVWHWLWDWPGGVVERLWSRVGDVWSWVWDRGADVWHWLWDIPGGLFDRVWGRVGDVWHWLWDWPGGAVERLWGRVGEVWNWLWDIPGGLFDRVWGRVGDVWHWLWDWPGGAVERLWGRIGWATDQILPRIAGAADNIVGGITEGFDKLGDILMQPFEFLADRIMDVGHFLVEGAWEPATEFFDRKLDVIKRLFRGEFDTWEDLWAATLNPPIAPLLIVAAFFGLLALNVLNVATSAIAQESIEPMVQRHRARIATRTLYVSDAQELLVRGEIDEGTFIDHLGRQGFSQDNARNLMALAQHIPGSGDLVRFAVREAFDRAKAEALGFITPLPGDFALWMERQGFGEEWSERFWWAHWDLPSVTQGFEMLHRDVIAPDDLEGLLIALDIPPKWIPRLLDISYSVVTRVDIRRLYQDGIVDEDEVELTYRRMGYSPEDARKITDMVKIRYARGGKGEGTDLRELTLSTIKQAYVRRLIDSDEALERLIAMDFPEEDAELIRSIWDFDLAQNPDQRSDIGLRELSASVIERAYERRLFDFNRALVELVELGYTQEDAEIKLHLVDFRMAEDLTELQIDGALNDLEAGLISPAEVESRLGEFGLPKERIDYLLQRELLRRQVKTRRLTVSQLLRARAAGHIATDDELLDRIGILGYNERDASILVKMV